MSWRIDYIWAKDKILQVFRKLLFLINLSVNVPVYQTWLIFNWAGKKDRNADRDVLQIYFYYFHQD